MSVTAKTAWGWIGVRATDRGIARVVLPCRRRFDVIKDLGGTAPGGEKAAAFEKKALFLMIEYFRTGKIRWNVPLDLAGASAFERSVWREAGKVPPGSVVTYGEMARRIGKPGAARAVGRALGRNPVPVAVPCHRIVGANGRLTGFSAPGGVELKARLIFHERAYGRE